MSPLKGEYLFLEITYSDTELQHKVGHFFRPHLINPISRIILQNLSMVW